jgi:hypothetical protein
MIDLDLVPRSNGGRKGGGHSLYRWTEGQLSLLGDKATGSTIGGAYR